MKSLFLAVLFFLLSGQIFGQISVASGTVKRLEKFTSKYVDARNVDVWLPEVYLAKRGGSRKSRSGKSLRSSADCLSKSN